MCINLSLWLTTFEVERFKKYEKKLKIQHVGVLFFLIKSNTTHSMDNNEVTLLKPISIITMCINVSS